MALLVLAFLGGILTVFSPCILPILPFVFSKADRPFRKSGLPLLAGMALTFAALATLATVGGGWIVRANQYGRIAAIVVLAIFGLTLLSESLATWLSRPLVRMGSRIASAERGGDRPDTGRSLLLGVATGLLWAPCAGPPRLDSHWRGGWRSERANRVSAARLRSRRRYLAGDCAAGRAISLWRAQEISDRRGLDSPRAGGDGAGGCGSDRVRLRSGAADAAFWPVLPELNNRWWTGCNRKRKLRP